MDCDLSPFIVCRKCGSAQSLSHPRVRQPVEFLNMNCHRANAQKNAAVEPKADKPTVIYLRHTPIGIALGCIAVVLALIFLVTTTLLACVVYPFIWLSIKSGLLAKRPSHVDSEAGQKNPRRFRFSNLVLGR
jgi:hypothetical protein